MDITINLILARLTEDHPEIRIEMTKEAAKAVITGIRLLPRDLDRPLREDILYLYDDAYSGESNIPLEDIHVIKITQKDSPEVKIGYRIVIICDIEIAILLSLLQDNFNLYKSWHSSLERILIEGGTIQKMIDQSEPILKTPFLIYDPSLKIIGRTMHVWTDDKMFNEVVRQGYLPDSAIRQFKSARIFQDLNLKGNTKSTPDNSKGHHDYILKLEDGKELLGYGALLQNDSNRDNQVYLFHVLCRLICEKLKKDQQQSIVTDYLLRDILDQSITDPVTIRERVKYAKLKYEDNYVLLLLTFLDNNNVPGSYAVNVFRNILLPTRAFLYKNDIIILLSLKKLNEVKFRHQLQEVKGKLEEELSLNEMKAVVSKSFRQISDIGIAYEQCKVGLLLGKKDDTFVFYEDYWLQHMLYLCNQQIPLTSFCEPVIWEIAAQKRSGAVPPLEILRVYLENDRNMTECAEQLHMHRNNVIYHISKLEDRYNLNLYDSNQRLRLLISLKIYDYQKEK